MSFLELILLSAGLAMDAFSVSVCKGTEMKRFRCADGVAIALSFGLFQAIMPIIGYFLGNSFTDRISAFDHWAAFIILGFIGAKMLFESLCASDNNDYNVEYRFSLTELLVLSVATSIDALAVGIVFAASKTHLQSAAVTIGLITFGLSFFGVAVGSRFGGKYGKRAEIAGGVMLILIGIKLLAEGLI